MMSEERRLELDFPAQHWGGEHTTGTLTRTVTPQNSSARHSSLARPKGLALKVLGS